jgi:hypothetical protein
VLASWWIFRIQFMLDAAENGSHSIMAHQFSHLGSVCILQMVIIFQNICNLVVWNHGSLAALQPHQDTVNLRYPDPMLAIPFRDVISKQNPDLRSITRGVIHYQVWPKNFLSWCYLNGVLNCFKKWDFWHHDFDGILLELTKHINCTVYKWGKK